MAHCRARFAQALVRTGVIDEYWLNIHPVALGRGLSLVPKLPTPLKLKLVSESRYSSGVIATVHQPA